MKLGIIMDPISKINIKKDSSFAMLLAAQKRGWNIQYMELDDLYMDNDTPVARMQYLKVADDLQEGHVGSKRQIHGLRVVDPSTESVGDDLDDRRHVGEVPALGSVAVHR